MRHSQNGDSIDIGLFHMSVSEVMNKSKLKALFVFVLFFMFEEFLWNISTTTEKIKPNVFVNKFLKYSAILTIKDKHKIAIWMMFNFNMIVKSLSR